VAVWIIAATIMAPHLNIAECSVNFRTMQRRQKG
jgi:hypothetical protein